MNDRKRDADTLATLDSLLAKGTGVSGMFGSARDDHKEAFQKWKASSLDFISESLGEDNQYYKDFASRVTDVTLSNCNIGIGVLAAIKKSLEEVLPKEAEAGISVKRGPREESSAEKPAAVREEVQLPKPSGPETGETSGVGPVAATRASEGELDVEKPPVDVIEKREEQGGEERKAQPPVELSLEAEETTKDETAMAPKAPQEEPETEEAPAVPEEKTGMQRPQPVRMKFADIPIVETGTVAAEIEKIQKKPETEEPPAATYKKETDTQPPEPPRPVPEERPMEKQTVSASTVPREKPVEKPVDKQPSSTKILEGLLWQAKVQLSQGHKDAAAVLCGAVLEEALRWMCLKHGIPSKEWDTVGELSDKLLGRAVYDESLHKEFLSWWYLREDAQSLNFDAYDKESVVAMVNGVQDFLKDQCSAFTTQDPAGGVREA